MLAALPKLPQAAKHIPPAPEGKKALSSTGTRQTELSNIIGFTRSVKKEHSLI